MLTLYSYPELFGAADNNPFGLKVYAFLKLCGLAFRHEHIFDASKAPRGQLPYLVDDDTAIGDSDTIISYLIARNALTIDQALTSTQRDTHLLVGRMLDDLYWVMSYSRWKDDRYWPLFRDAILGTHPEVTAASLETAREYNFKRYHFQGIGRREPDAAYARGIAALQLLANLLPASGFLFGAQPSSIDDAMASIIGHGLATRFPKLRFMPVEFMTGWLRPFIARMQAAYERSPVLFDEDPFEVFKRNIYVHIFHEPDPQGLLDIGLTADRLMFGSDFPHGEGLARPGEYAAAQLGGFSDGDVRRIMRDNFEDFFVASL